MKYTVEIVIDSPLGEVTEFLSNPHHLAKRMKGLQGYQVLRGIYGQKGSRTRLIFKRETIMETCMENRLPYHFIGVYESPWVRNTVRNEFLSIDSFQTRYRTRQEFRFKGLLNVFRYFIPKAIFRQQSMKYLVNYKWNVENQLPVLNKQWRLKF